MCVVRLFKHSACGHGSYYKLVRECYVRTDRPLPPVPEQYTLSAILDRCRRGNHFEFGQDRSASRPYCRACIRAEEQYIRAQWQTEVDACENADPDEPGYRDKYLRMRRAVHRRNEELEAWWRECGGRPT